MSRRASDEVSCSHTAGEDLEPGPTAVSSSISHRLQLVANAAPGQFPNLRQILTEQR